MRVWLRTILGAITLALTTKPEARARPSGVESTIYARGAQTIAPDELGVAGAAARELLLPPAKATVGARANGTLEGVEAVA